MSIFFFNHPHFTNESSKSLNNLHCTRMPLRKKKITQLFGALVSLHQGMGKVLSTHLNSLECHDVYESCLETNSPVQSGDLKFDHFEVSIFNLKSPTALHVIDLRCLVILWRRNSRGQGGQRPYQQ